MKGHDMSLEEMNMNTLNMNHEFEIGSDVENENIVGQIPKFHPNPIPNNDKKYFKEEKKVDNNFEAAKSKPSNKLLKFSKMNPSLDPSLFKWMKGRKSPEPHVYNTGVFRRFQIGMKGKSDKKLGRSISRNSQDYEKQEINTQGFSERQIRFLFQAERKLKTLAQQREFEMLKECTFIPKIKRIPSQKGLSLQGLKNSNGFKTLQSIEILNNLESTNGRNQIRIPQSNTGVGGSIGSITFNNQSNISLSNREKQQFILRLKNDIKKINSIQKKPQINPKSKKIVEEKKMRQNQITKNGFDRFHCKGGKKDNAKFPFKPQINSIPANMYIPSNDKSQKMLDIALKKHEKLLSKLKEKQLIEEFNSVKKNEKNAKIQIITFNKEFDTSLTTLQIYSNKVTKENTNDLLIKMNFMSKKPSSQEYSKFEDLWSICIGKNEDTAKIENVKTVLIAISGLINISFIDFNKDETTNSNVFLKLEKNDLELKSINIDQKEKIVPENNIQSNEFMKQFTYDNDGILLLSYKNILYLKKRFVSLYCNRFSRITKGAGIINENGSNLKVEKCENKIKKIAITSQKKIKFKNKTKPILGKSPPNEKSIKQGSKKDIIAAIASNSSININSNEDLVNKRSDKSSKFSIFEKINSFKKARMNNKSVEEIDFERSKNNLTFSPEIHKFSLKQNKKGNQFSKFEEKAIQRMRMGSKARSVSSRVILSKSKEGITALKCDTTYRKYWNQFKSLDESDKTLQKLVKKYTKRKIETGNCNSMSFDPLNGKIKEGISLELLNFYEQNRAILDQKIILEKEKEKEKSSNNNGVISTIIENTPSDIDFSNQPIAIIKINNPEGACTIAVNKNSKLPEIASKIANENNLTDVEKEKILAYLEEQVKAKINI